MLSTKHSFGHQPLHYLIIFTAGCYEKNFDYHGNDLNWWPKHTKTALECQGLCKKTSACQFFTFVPNKNNCWLKKSSKGRTAKTNLISGPKECFSNPPQTKLQLNSTGYSSLLQGKPATAANAIAGES